MAASILTPAAILVCWTLAILLWLVASRFAAFGKANIDLSKAKPGGRGQDLEGVLPDRTNWKSHNYTHLMEQPTIFYPTVVILYLSGATTLDTTLAWVYVGLRIAHSLWQTTVNLIPVRASLFFLSSLVLIVLAIRALQATVAFNPGVIV